LTTLTPLTINTLDNTESTQGCPANMPLAKLMLRKHVNYLQAHQGWR